MGVAAEQSFYLPYGARLVVTMDVSNAITTLGLVRGRLKNTRPILLRIAALIRKDYREQFSNAGPGWRNLAASTIAAKAIAGLPARTKKGNIPRRLVQRGAFGASNILMGEGNLRDSWGLKRHKDHVESINSRDNTVRVGSKDPKAKYHQHGTNGYIILAKAGKALAFTGGNGGMVFRAKVYHPGLPARSVSISDTAVEAIRSAIIEYVTTGKVALDEPEN